ncbi:MAG: hypothetical protein DRP93_01195 [Candidatus Neomarinimicrobiota bacterium]|nr:MAG: hypothetical protein DRP93_01195 [Candidatus Neomarinimicrobiota bacterium]
MNTISITLIFLALIIYVSPSISIYKFLKKSNDKLPNFIYVNLNIFHYLKQYRKKTKILNGNAGPLYYLWFLTLSISVVLIIVAVLIRNI